MFSSDTSGSVASLVSAAEGESLVIHSLLFERVRRDCLRQGVEAGAVVLCRRRSDAGLYLETQSGRRALIPWDRARFVRVERIPGGG